MENRLFSNTHVISWLSYFSENTDIDLEHVKILDITRKNKNLIPAVEAHKTVLVFTEAGHPDIFYKMYSVGLGDCTVIYNEGSDPVGPIKRDKVENMIDRGINASAGMIILNPNARSTVKFGMDNSNLASGSVKYVGSEIRNVILSKMQITEGKNLCVISGESIVVEAAILDGEGTIIAVEYNHNDRRTMEDNIAQFGLHNVTVIDHVAADTMKDLPVPDVTMLVASASMEQEMKYMLSINPNMEFVIYTLDFVTAANMPKICADLGIRDPEIIQISVSKLTSKNTFAAQPAPWIITCKAGE
ncbi:MAG: precorrin-6B methylase [Lachnospiraceae bacterium]|nr:precorrin-6B methylase [Lachnospiraceae bacterium]